MLSVVIKQFFCAARISKINKINERRVEKNDEDASSLFERGNFFINFENLLTLRKSKKLLSFFFKMSNQGR